MIGKSGKVAKWRVVIDTNVMFSALYSNRGVSYELISLLAKGAYVPIISNTLCTEYEEVLKGNSREIGLRLNDIDSFLDAVCVLSERVQTTEQWMPLLKDADDEAVAQLAVEAKADCIVTHNAKHFGPLSKMGIVVKSPFEFVTELRAKS